MIEITKTKQAFKKWIASYQDQDQLGFQLKVTHTEHVVENAKKIAESLNCSKEDIALAQAIAVLHDIGRFEELKENKQFSSATYNHAARGVEVLWTNNRIRDFIEDASYDTIIQKAILNHNTLKIEKDLSERELLHAKIIRDADKLDNFRVKREEKIEAIFPNIVKEKEEMESSSLSKKVYDAVKKEQCVDIHDRQTPLDYWVCVLAFIYDLSFQISYKIIKQKKDIDALIDRFEYQNEKTKEEMEDIRKRMNRYIEKKGKSKEEKKMKKRTFAIIEIGSNNTKTHVYENGKTIYEKTDTIEFKKNYAQENKIAKEDITKLKKVMEKAKKLTEEIYVYGCSIFRKITEEEKKEVENEIQQPIEVVTQEEEAELTALGCIGNLKTSKKICVFIGGGGSTELALAKNGKIIDRKYYNFGVVDLTKKFSSLKEDVPTCSFKEVYEYVEDLMKDLDWKAEILILAGGDHLYWYENAEYPLEKNTLYEEENQPYMITREQSDSYDEDAYQTSLDKIRARSDNPVWFDGSRAMKAITNFISHRIDAKYIIPTRVNMEDGLKQRIEK